jgi:hypothetical protein
MTLVTLLVVFVFTYLTGYQYQEAKRGTILRSTKFSVLRFFHPVQELWPS